MRITTNGGIRPKHGKHGNIGGLLTNPSRHHMRQPPRQLLKILSEPDTWDPLAFETAIRNDVETSTGPCAACDELLIAMLVMTVETLIQAHKKVLEFGPVYKFNSGEAPSAWLKIRTESLDKAIKILAELALVARGRPKLTARPADVDELFAMA